MILIRSQALAADHIIGVETGSCSHAAIREDASTNLAATRWCASLLEAA